MKHLPHENFLIAFGTHLKKLRKDKGFSQEKLAYESNIELRQIGRIERGEINTGIYSIAILAETLGLEIKQFFEFEY